MPGSVKRPYDASRRQEQARLTRARIRDAATELFTEQGYVATSVAAIAERAGVAPQTVYASFGTKVALLSEAIGVAMAGDDEPLPVYERAQRVIATDSPAEAAAVSAAFATRLFERAGGLLLAADAAAQVEPEIRELWEEGQRQRLQDQQRLAAELGDAGLLREGLTATAAGDLLWALVSPDTWRAFTVVRGWSARRFERWLADAIHVAILRD